MRSKLKEGVGIVHGHAVVGEQGEQEGTKHSSMRGPRVECQHDRCVLAYPRHLKVACQEVQSQGPGLSNKLGGHYCVEH